MTLTYRSYAIRYTNGDTCRPETHHIDPADIADACHGGPDVKDIIAEQLCYHQIENDKVAEFRYRKVENTRLVGVKAFTVGMVERAYGGPEEGGWWFDDFEP